jgi:hypothetical protein
LNRWKHLFVTVSAAACAAGFAACTAVPRAAVPVAPAPAAAPGTAAKVTDVKSLLWVGNSFFYYNNSMHDHVRAMLTAAKVTGTRQNSITISAAGIDWHDLEPHLRPGSGVGRYSFTPTNDVVFNKFDKPYDAVLIMDCSQCPIHPVLGPVFHEWAKKHSDTVRKYGGEPALFASWAYEDKPEMTQQLSDEYVKAGKANRALVVPAGIAFAESIKRRADLKLHMPDKRHPTLAGTYLASAVVLASVFKTNPVGSTYTAGLPADVVAHLQQVAWDTVKAFEAKEGRGSL